MKKKLSKTLKIKLLKGAIWQQQRYSGLGMCGCLTMSANSLLRRDDVSAIRGLRKGGFNGLLDAVGITKRKYLDKSLLSPLNYTPPGYWYPTNSSTFQKARVSHLKAALKELQKR